MRVKSLLALTMVAALAGCSTDNEEEEFVFVPNQTGTVTITASDGIPNIGETLMANVSDPDGVDTSAVSFQWQVNGQDIAGATNSSYTVDASEVDIGDTLTVVATYTDNSGFNEDIESESTAPVEGDGLPVNTAGTLAIQGSPSVGTTLTAVLVDDNGFTDVSYQWFADGAAIDGATGVTFELTVGQLEAAITVTAAYTDNDGFGETVTSDATGPVASEVVNVIGTLSDPITGTLEVGSTLTAPTPVDPNGIGGTIMYQWQSRASGSDMAADITGATEQTFTPTLEELGDTLSVQVSYTDDDGFDEALFQELDDIIYSFLVNGEASLIDAIASVEENGIIGLGSAGGGENYADMAELTITTNNVTLTRTTDSDAVILGETCIIMGADTTGIVMDGLVFDDLTIRETDTCFTEGWDGSIIIDGSASTFRNSEILGEADDRPSFLSSSDDVHYITVRGVDHIIERNLFEGKSPDENEEGAAISMFIATNDDDEPNTLGAHARNIVQYNLFRNFTFDVVLDDLDSNSFAVQVGRSTSADGTGRGEHIVQFNRFDNVLMDRRLIQVQGGGNTITGNTIVNSWGNIALENGFDNTVSNNIIISSAQSVEGRGSQDGGISFAPLGHTIVDNFVANTTSTSNDRAGLHIDSDPLDQSSGETIIASGLDLTTVVARNTFINNDRAIQFENQSGSGSACTLLDYILDFDDNLIANQSEDMNIFGTNSGDSDSTIIEDAYQANGCAMASASDFDNNHFYSNTVSDATLLLPVRGGGSALTNGVDGNIAADGSEDGATLTAVDGNGLVEGSGADAGIGAALNELQFIEEDMVGPGSTWVANEGSGG